MRGRGHRVTVLTSSYFEPLVPRAGLEFESFATAEEYHSLAQNPDLWSRWRGFATVAKHGILPSLHPCTAPSSAAIRPARA